MNEEFELSDTDEVNAANPCCCPEPACLYADLESQTRDSLECKGGWLAYAKTDNYPAAFDMLTVGKLIPLYKVRTVSRAVVKSGALQSVWKYTSGGITEQTFTYNATVAYEATFSVTSEYGKQPWDFPAGTEPLGPCPPHSLIFATAATPTGIQRGATEDGLTEVTLKTAENRPDHPAEIDEEGNPIKAGFYQWMVDNQIAGTTGGPELVIYLNEDDATCHEFTVRHVCGGYGAWGKPKVFSLKSNPCCKAPEPAGCNEFAEGNSIGDKSQASLTLGGESWTTRYSNTLGDSSSDASIDDACAEDGIDNIPGSSFTPRPALEYVFSGIEGYTSTESRTASQDSIVQSWARNSTNSVEDDGSTGWYEPTFSDVGTANITDTTTLSQDQNRGTATINTMFATLLARVKGYPATYGWGLSIAPVGGFFGGNARAVGSYPETQAGFAAGGGILRVQLREYRHRWSVRDDHEGTLYKTKWNVGKFHDRWLTWRGEYYQWAVGKYTFLSQPKKGDDDYPKLADFANDPDTPENEAKTALKDAIDAINAIPDPGAAPVEPQDLRPSIVGNELLWEWSSSQGEQAEEVIDPCDPTKTSRELQAPLRPERADYGTSESFKTALDAYDAAVIAHEAAIEQRKADSKRQSPWFIMTPDVWSDWRGKPDPVPDLPTEPLPTKEDREQHALAIKEYDFLLLRYNTEIHAGFYLCNVRHICLESPHGTIENTDHRFPTTRLPHLDPSKEDPARWVRWFR